jgi:hypothetical protein
MLPEETVQNAKQNLSSRSGAKPAGKSASRSAASKAKKATSAKPRPKAPRTRTKPA